MNKVLPEVTVFAGPMGAGKTTELYATMGRLAHIHRPYAVYEPGIDVRDEAILPKSYTGKEGAVTRNCTTVSSLDDIPVAALVAAGTHIIMLDEWFMFGYDEHRQPIPGIYLRTMMKWAKQGITRVYAAGLDQAANGHQFDVVVDARRFGAEVVIYTALCEFPINGATGPRCGNIARNSQIYDARDGRTFTMDSLPSLLPEGIRLHDRYRAVCAQHLLLPAEATKPFTLDSH